MYSSIIYCLNRLLSEYPNCERRNPSCENEGARGLVTKLNMCGSAGYPEALCRVTCYVTLLGQYGSLYSIFEARRAYPCNFCLGGLSRPAMMTLSSREFLPNRAEIHHGDHSVKHSSSSVRERYSLFPWPEEHNDAASVRLAEQGDTTISVTSRITWLFSFLYGPSHVSRILPWIPNGTQWPKLWTRTQASPLRFTSALFPCIMHQGQGAYTLNQRINCLWWVKTVTSAPILSLQNMHHTMALKPWQQA